MNHKDGRVTFKTVIHKLNTKTKNNNIYVHKDIDPPFKIKIASDFTDTPGSRYMENGPYSGEQFREELLLKKFDMALANKSQLIIDLDGCYGYLSSFLEEAFGGLRRRRSIIPNRTIKKTLKFISADEPSLPYVIRKYIDNGLKD